MAQSNQAHAAHDTDTDTAAADKAAWLTTGEALGFRIADGELWGGANGALYIVPPLAGFASLGADAQRSVLYSLAKMVDYRIGQTATGNVNDSAAKFVSGAGFSPERSCDAFESHYVGTIRSMIVAKLQKAADEDWKANGKTGNAPKVKTTDKVTQGDVSVTVQSIITKSAEKYRASQFEPIVRKAVAAGRNRVGKASGEPTSRGLASAAELEFDA